MNNVTCLADSSKHFQNTSLAQGVSCFQPIVLILLTISFLEQYLISTRIVSFYTSQMARSAGEEHFTSRITLEFNRYWRLLFILSKFTNHDPTRALILYLMLKFVLYTPR